MRHARSLLLLCAVLAMAACSRQAQYARGSYGYAAPVYSQPLYPPQQGYPQPAYAASAPAPGAYAPAGYAQPPAYPYPQFGSEEPYTLDAGDRLRVVVFGQEGLTASYAIDAAGNLSMPLIGSVPARGLTTRQLSEEIAAQLRQGFIREPHVAVEIEAYRPFFILGEVTFPGQYPNVANMTVETAVAIAGGFSPRAKRGPVALTRSYGGQLGKGSVPRYAQVRPGDTIMVAERWF